MSIRIAGELLREQEKEYEAKLAELTRLTALLEDRTKLIQLLMQPIPIRDSPFNSDFFLLSETNAGMLADRLIAYLKPLG